MKSARAGAERIWYSRIFKKWRNSVWISHFLKGTDVVKDPAFRRRRFIQRFPSIFSGKDKISPGKFLKWIPFRHISVVTENAPSK